MHSIRQVNSTLLSVAFTFTLVAGAYSSTLPLSATPVAAVCKHTHCNIATGSDFRLSVPNGNQPCADSSGDVTCNQSAATNPDPGQASTPVGTAACGADPNKALAATPASCGDTLLASANSSSPHALKLSVSSDTAVPGTSVVLTATSDSPVTGASSAIEIFDESTRKLIGACAQGGQCSVAYAAHAGVHNFVAFVTPPTATLPSSGLASNHASVSWIGVSWASTSLIVGPGRPAIATATSTIAIDKTGWLLQIYDTLTHARLAYCAHGNTCATSMSESFAGAHSVVAVLSKASATAPGADAVVAQTDVLTARWLGVTVSAQTTNPNPGGVVSVNAYSNSDLTNTPWALGIFDDRGQLVAPLCKQGSACHADLTITGALPSFSAAIGAVPQAPQPGPLGSLIQKISGPSTLVDIQARSELVKPVVRTTRLLWGVDSCQSFTDDPTGGSGQIQSVVSNLGSPDFYGRYLTDTVCPGISGAEISAAARNYFGILPIYNDYDCSNVVGYDTGAGYGNAAIAAAHRLGIPYGRALVIDIEPPGDACPGAGNVDAGFVEGWYDAITAGSYVATYYANGTDGSEFANAWCAAAASRPDIKDHAYLWSFEPSFTGGFGKGNAPTFQPNPPSCGGHSSAWQYELSGGSDPNVDQDLAVSELPIWYP